MPPPTLCALAVLLLAFSHSCHGQQMGFMDHCPPNDIPASGNVTDLTELTFWGKVSDGRVWFVEFYAGERVRVSFRCSVRIAASCELQDSCQHSEAGVKHVNTV
jgi:hypothetical protein